VTEFRIDAPAWLGSIVHIVGDTDIKATVTAICVKEGGVELQCVWWNGRVLEGRYYTSHTHRNLYDGGVI
jgi:hypothetical protein